MAKKGMIEFSVTQTGAIELTENMGGDPAFKVPVELLGNHDKVNEAGTKLEALYYHSSEGWKPVIEGEEASLSDLGLEDNELENRLSMAFDRLGNRALGNLFRLGEKIWDLFDTAEDQIASVDYEEVDELITSY